MLNICVYLILVSGKILNQARLKVMMLLLFDINPNSIEALPRILDVNVLHGTVYA
jgi:hypothetical protein